MMCLGLVIGLSALVGCVGSSRDEFDWDLTAVFGTALGTTLLAIATGGLALFSFREVTATQELAQLTRDDQVAQQRPVVVMVGWKAVYGSPSHLVVQLMNVGRGPALRVELHAEDIRDGKPMKVVGPARELAIPPDTTRELALEVEFPSGPEVPPQTDFDDFRYWGSYLDRSLQGDYRILTDWSDVPG
jgi:hypothetical protein